MDTNTVTLVIGICGIVATLISSSLGIYFTAKARSSNLREFLYTRQINLVVRIISKLGRTKNFLTILADEDSEYKSRAREDLASCVMDLSALTEEGAAILPTELWIEIKRLSQQVTSLAIEYDKDDVISTESFYKFIGMDTKVALVSRNILGVDELTEESIKLFTSKKKYESLANIEASIFENMAREKTKK